jgi:small-conductance mechanosensitive channel
MPPVPIMAAPAAKTLPVQVPSPGYLYQLFRTWGASDFAAKTAQFLLVRPLEVLMIVTGAWLAGRIGARVARRSLAPVARRVAQRAGAARAPKRVETVTQTVSSLWKVSVWVIALLMILATIGINLTPLVAGATVVGAALAFGAQRIVLDVLSGFFLLVEDQFGVGDSVAIGDTEGVVEEFHLRVTQLRGADGTRWFVPNGEIRVLGNRSKGSGGRPPSELPD